MIVARRVYLYGIAFAALWMLVNGIGGLLQVALEAIVEAALGPFNHAASSEIANRVSLYGALTGIGLVTWTIHWWLVARSVARDPCGESGSAIRKLYLYGFLLSGGLYMTFDLRQFLAGLLGLAFGTVSSADLANGEIVPALSMLLAVGAFAVYHARVAQRDRAVSAEIGRGATIRRWCVYVLAFVALMTMLFGLSHLIARLIDLTIPIDGEKLTSGRWLAIDVAERTGTVLAGLIVWLLAWSWSARELRRTTGPDLERDSVLRKVYLYVVLLSVVSWAVWNISQMLYVVIRSLLIPAQAGVIWSTVQRDLGETVAYSLVFGLAWAYHARVLQREAAAAPEQHRQATIRWIHGYIVALIGASTLGFGLAGVLSTALDLLFAPGVVQGEHWWQERLALAATLILVGLPVWLIPWTRLQREAVAAVARRSLARRIYLFLALGITVLTLLGSGAYTLYQLLRVALGERWTSGNTSDLIEAASAAAVAALFLAYHLRVFQRDAALARKEEAAAPPTPAVPTPLLPAPASVSTNGGQPVTMLVVRPATGQDAAQIRQRIQSALPPGTTVETVTVSASEAERLLGA
jgi:hypothetical protein